MMIRGKVDDSCVGLRIACRQALVTLPDDVLFTILSFCDNCTLGRLARVCKRLHHLIQSECVWVKRLKRCTPVGDPRNERRGIEIPARERCHLASNWKHKTCKDSRLIYHKVRQLPWLQMDHNYLWASMKNLIRCYRQTTTGQLQELFTITAFMKDVTKFVAKDDLLLSGGRDGSIGCFDALTGQPLSLLHRRHDSDVHSVDFSGSLVVSGSRDATVKLWMMEGDGGLSSRKTIHINNRVWSVACNPDGSTFAVGTAGTNSIAPLSLYDASTSELLSVLGNNFRNGAGILDIQYESPHTLISCGYDTYIRQWDTRVAYEQCVCSWEEPFDSAVYCIKTDGDMAMVAGTARHGMARLWDRRMRHSVQVYYVGHSNSPVYSLTFDPRHLYVALDKGINMLDFSVK